VRCREKRSEKFPFSLSGRLSLKVGTLFLLETDQGGKNPLVGEIFSETGPEWSLKSTFPGYHQLPKCLGGKKGSSHVSFSPISLPARPTWTSSSTSVTKEGTS